MNYKKKIDELNRLSINEYKKTKLPSILILDDIRSKQCRIDISHCRWF